MIPRSILSAIEKDLGLKVGHESSLSGGDISAAYKLSTNKGDLFLKINSSSESLHMFQVEANGLQLIAETNAIKTPMVLSVGETHEGAYLALEAINSKRANAADLKLFGHQLSEMHNITKDVFGLEYDNYIGSLAQYNQAHETWLEFYTHERLKKQYDLAHNKNLLSNQEIPDLETLISGCRPFFQDIQPSLLHGDLWNGNYMIDQKGTPILIDPAVYFGHAEVDIAMSLLFDGFGSDFYDSYFENRPKTEGFSARMDLYKLYYLLVHLNLFGSSYKSSVMRITNDYFQL